MGVSQNQIRAARTADLPAVAALYHRVWRETHAAAMPPAEREARDLAYFEAKLSVLPTNILLLEDGDKLAGFAAWSGPILGQLFFDATWRGQGLARPLLMAAEREMARQGVVQAELHCLEGNIRARDFYERNGWRLDRTFAYPVRGGPGDDTRNYWAMIKPL
ncbi:GNAT family N-acetyltransferase [Caulobacter sp. RHG1]|uniref:GNAT family N-acetyltransferase n=1 Tax=Caulobacter sp. (strain RHG1) TaxID=2545762 RepID=UPI001554B081|nr:GNAT family N-acetyltransferase [Caulobacter sp. RHG1]NQE62617.1 hypothetical protein [Caulobacter sp. RHG1]